MYCNECKREHQPRERAVKCMKCRRANTFNFHALCDNCRPEVEPTPTCRWFLNCIRPAEGVVKHPVLGKVLCCSRCADRFDLELLPINPGPEPEQPEPRPTTPMEEYAARAHQRRTGHALRGHYEPQQEPGEPFALVWVNDCCATVQNA